MIIAITGCIGSGKTYILNKINELYGYDIFSADVIAKNSYDDEIVKNKLHKEFKCVINGKVDKNLIKEKLNDTNIEVLNNIIHPYVKKQIKNIKSNYENNIAFIEVPLLFESKMEDIFDASLVVSTNEKIINLRLKNRNPEVYKSMLKLEKFQLSNDEKVKRATYVLISSDDENSNLKQLDNIIKSIKERRSLYVYFQFKRLK